MKIEEAIRYFERELKKIEEAEAIEASAAEPDEEVLHAWSYEREATDMAHTARHELCHPASLICESDEVAQKMTENLEDVAGCAVDIDEAEQKANQDVIAQREEALAQQLEDMRKRKRRLVDPLQFEMSIQAEDLAGYIPSFGWEMMPPSDAQCKELERAGILPDQIDNAGKASLLLDRIRKRRMDGLSTPKQIRCLERYGFSNVGTWSFDGAKNMIDRIASNCWRVPRGVTPKEFRPER